jgi:superfamily I DNA and/or RNA helicase/very-short-patch-repair endonuclease
MAELISQIKFDEIFIKKLLDKLKIGNTRSIHLNAIPGRSATRLDLFQLSDIEENLPENFIYKLLNQESFLFEISYDRLDLGKLNDDKEKSLKLISKKLNTIVIENNDNYLEFGIKNFGFGFPLLIKRDKTDPTKIIKAPLFIWNLDIEISSQNKNTWIIKRDEDFSIKLNELLISHLAKDESILLEKISKDILDDGLLDESELLELCKNILSQLNVKEENINIKIERCPDAKLIDEIANSKPWIKWSGVFGIYLSQKETIIKSTEELLENIEKFQNETLILEQFQTSTITAIETDPSKDEILNTLTKNEIKLIQGPPGTGKSQSITAIISNALANKAKCLIVCEKKTALDVIQSNLEKVGLGKFSILIDDVNKDRKKVIIKARDLNESRDNCNFNESEFKIKYENYCKIRDELNKKYCEPLKKILGDFSWKHLIGLYLRFSKSDNFKYLREKLSYDFLQFTYDEYSQYLNIIEEASLLYEDLKKESEIIFDCIDKDIFKKRFNLQIYETIKNETNSILDFLIEIIPYIKTKNNNDCKIANINLFTPKSIDEGNNLINIIVEKHKKINELYTQGNILIGASFDKKNYFQDFTFLVGSIFSTKYKKICQLRTNINEISKSLIEKIPELEELGFKEIEIKDFETFTSFKELNNYFINSLGKFEKIRLKIISIIEIKEKLNQYEEKLMKFLSNKVYLLQYKSFTSLNTIENVLKYYNEIYNQVEKVSHHLDSYESFHNWKFFELNRNNNELKILSVFKEIPSDEWKNLFKAWYYRGVLLNYEQHSKIGFNKSDKKLQQLAELHQELKSQQLKQIKHIWDKKRTDKINSLTYSFNTLYNLNKNKTFGRRNSLRKIIETNLELFTTFFPVILTNPSVVNSIFPLKKGLFEIVIFDEASQLRISDTFTSLIRGQYKIIAGDKHQMPPSNYFQSNSEFFEEENEDIFTEEDEQAILAESESLLQYAEDLNNINKSYLDYHYRSEHPDLIAFSNYAFYGGNLIPFPSREAYSPIVFRYVNGKYETRTNLSEILEIIKIIQEEIPPNKNGEYPSLGIATFNINQRNLIIETLNKFAEEDSTFAYKLQLLREKGLFIKNLENIQGDERDIIIISTTYGIKPDGKFSQNFARLNTIEGYKLLNVLITRAKKKLFVCTSIPKEKYHSYKEIIENEGNNRKGILYAYLTYAEAISNNDKETAQNVLNTLRKQSYEEPRNISQNDGLSESPFEEEVYQELLCHFDHKDIFQQYKIGGFRLDFVIKTKSKYVVLECDGKSYHQSNEAHAHDIYRQKELEKMGFIVYRIWSTNWFQDKVNEMQKLLAFIQSL